MSPVTNESGTRVTSSTLAKTPVATPEPRFTITDKVLRTTTMHGSDAAGSEVLFHAGQVVKQSEIDAAFPAATAGSITPATGLAAGGTVVTIKGTDLHFATGVTFGGTAGTAFKVVSNGTVKVTAPAKTAGAQAVVVQTDTGNVTAGNFTYT